MLTALAFENLFEASDVDNDAEVGTFFGSEEPMGENDQRLCGWVTWCRRCRQHPGHGEGVCAKHLRYAVDDGIKTVSSDSWLLQSAVKRATCTWTECRVRHRTARVATGNIRQSGRLRAAPPSGVE